MGCSGRGLLTNSELENVEKADCLQNNFCSYPMQEVQMRWIYDSSGTPCMQLWHTKCMRECNAAHTCSSVLYRHVSFNTTRLVSNGRLHLTIGRL